MKCRSTVVVKMGRSVRNSSGAQIVWLKQRKNRYVLFLLGLISLLGSGLALKVSQINLYWLVMIWGSIFAISSVLCDLRDEKKMGRRLKRDFFIYIGWKVTIRNETAATILL